MRIPQYRNFRLELPKYRMKNCPIPQYRKPQCPPPSRYKAAEPLTLKESDEVSKAFQIIYKRGPLKWPQLLTQGVTQGVSLCEL